MHAQGIVCARSSPSISASSLPGQHARALLRVCKPVRLISIAYVSLTGFLERIRINTINIYIVYKYNIFQIKQITQVLAESAQMRKD